MNQQLLCFQAQWKLETLSTVKYILRIPKAFHTWPKPPLQGQSQRIAYVKNHLHKHQASILPMLKTTYTSIKQAFCLC